MIKAKLTKEEKNFCSRIRDEISEILEKESTSGFPSYNEFQNHTKLFSDIAGGNVFTIRDEVRFILENGVCIRFEKALYDGGVFSYTISIFKDPESKEKTVLSGMSSQTRLVDKILSKEAIDILIRKLRQDYDFLTQK